MNDFTGVKVGLFLGDQLLIIQRDDIPNLPFAGLWDFPGGGREDEESPIQCAIREIYEELGLCLTSSAFKWSKKFYSTFNNEQKALFLIAQVDASVIADIHFGNEGKAWKLISPHDFLSLKTAIALLQIRLQMYLDEK